MNKFMRLFALLLVVVAIVLVVLAFEFGGHEKAPQTAVAPNPPIKHPRPDTRRKRMP